MEQFPGDQRLRVWLWVLMKWLEFKAVRRVVCIDTAVAPGGRKYRGRSFQKPGVQVSRSLMNKV